MTSNLTKLKLSVIFYIANIKRMCALRLILSLGYFNFYIIAYLLSYYLSFLLQFLL